MICEREPWTARAACRGLDPDLFVPGRGQPAEPALAVCNGWNEEIDPDILAAIEKAGAKTFLGRQGPCPVRRECAAHRVLTNSMGVWGGRFFSSEDWLSEQKAVERQEQVAQVIILKPIRDGRPRPIDAPATEGIMAVADVLRRRA